MDEDLLRTVKEQAAYLRLPVQTLYSWRHQGIGPPAVRVGRSLRYRASDTEAWLKGSKREAS